MDPHFQDGGRRPSWILRLVTTWGDITSLILEDNGPKYLFQVRKPLPLKMDTGSSDRSRSMYMQGVKERKISITTTTFCAILLFLCQVSINCLLVNLHLIDHVDYYLKSQEIKISGATMEMEVRGIQPLIHQISPLQRAIQCRALYYSKYIIISVQINMINILVT